jgi:hypothetical protein
VREPWLGRVGVVEVSVFAAPSISTPIASWTVHAPWVSCDDVFGENDPSPRRGCQAAPARQEAFHG